jgi:phage-related protein
MKTVSIKELMVPLNEYATVSENATLADAIQALDHAQETFCQNKYRHRAILVLDKNQQPMGKIGQIDALRALEPKYKEIQNQDTRGAFRHFSRMFLNSMIVYHRLFVKWKSASKVNPPIIESIMIGTRSGQGSLNTFFIGLLLPTIPK